MAKLGAQKAVRAETAEPELQELDVSVVIPCLNEEGSVATVVEKALAGIAAAGLRGEVIVADSFSIGNASRRTARRPQ